MSSPWKSQEVASRASRCHQAEKWPHGLQLQQKIGRVASSVRRVPAGPAPVQAEVRGWRSVPAGCRRAGASQPKRSEDGFQRLPGVRGQVQLQHVAAQLKEGPRLQGSGRRPWRGLSGGRGDRAVGAGEGATRQGGRSPVAAVASRVASTHTHASGRFLFILSSASGFIVACIWPAAAPQQPRWQGSRRTEPPAPLTPRLYAPGGLEVCASHPSKTSWSSTSCLSFMLRLPMGAACVAAGSPFCTWARARQKRRSGQAGGSMRGQMDESSPARSAAQHSLMRAAAWSAGQAGGMRRLCLQLPSCFPIHPRQQRCITRSSPALCRQDPAAAAAAACMHAADTRLHGCGLLGGGGDVGVEGLP